MTVTGSSIYWGEYYAGAIGRANLDGTDPNESFISTGGVGTNPYGLAADGTYLYWTDDESGSIGRAALDGSGVIPAFISAGNAKGEWGLAVGRIDGAAPPPGAGEDEAQPPATNRDPNLASPALLLTAALVAVAGVRTRRSALRPGQVRGTPPPAPRS